MLLVRWQNLVDFLVLAAAIYVLLRWSREARALRLALILLGLRAGVLLARQLNLIITAWVLDAATIVGIVILLVVFQPELRHALGQLDVPLRSVRERQVLAPALQAISTAAFSLAAARRGALVVIARHDSVAELIRGGVPLGGQVSTEILEAIFRKVSPVHDGATIVEGDQITRVAAILPLTHREDVPKFYGTRHRAAMGLAERCDALVVVASEERGEMTLMCGREIRQMNSPDELAAALRERTLPAVAAPRLRGLLWSGDLRLKASAVGPVGGCA